MQKGIAPKALENIFIAVEVQTGRFCPNVRTDGMDAYSPCNEPHKEPLWKRQRFILKMNGKKSVNPQIFSP